MINQLKTYLKNHVPAGILDTMWGVCNRNKLNPSATGFELENLILDTLPSISALKRNTDDQSQKVIDSFIKKQMILAYNELIRVPDVDRLLKHVSTEESYNMYKNPDIINKNQDYLSFKNKYNLSGDCDIGFYHAGLRNIPSNILKEIQKGCVLDCGAYDGESSFMFDTYSPTKIFSFEPVNETINKLKQNIEKFSFSDKIEVVPFGVSDKKETLKISSNHSVSNSTNEEMNQRLEDLGFKIEFEDIHTISIDEFVKENNIEKVSLIKYDVEGAEYKGIVGARETICNHKPILLVSLYHTLKDFLEIKPLIESWGELGYKFYFRENRPIPSNYPNFSTRSLFSTEYMLIAYVE